MKKVLIAAGGTGGHIYPALAVANELRKKDIEVIFVGTKTRMEKDIIPANNFKFVGLDIIPFRKLKSLFKALKATIKIMKIIKKEKIENVIGFGNYISVPAILAGLIYKKNIYLHEQNVKMGQANRWFYRFSKKTFVSFDDTFEEMPLKYQDKVIVTGNPLREEFYNVNRLEERKRLKISENEKVILITGGSLGAKSINEFVLKNWERFFKEKDFRVYWATGKINFDEINNKITKLKNNDVIKPYFENMHSIMEVADIVISRAGASIISELIELSKPSILIPYNFVGQYENAKILEDIGATVLFKDEEIDSAMDYIFELGNDRKKLLEISNNIKKLKKGNSTRKIVEELDIWRKI
ncbi:undecaprenyldiphospho-muramoylpentapeptide beta-N-acetylglucosaminyltransferase [Haliovirga abyssi]|uniref:UDP-N-acetylglucosamine--N-acetylmuramyl-(pentapeptide) pyrophosphoryl-undecaprenol N-acetylglucosamine transferase n=1 Tax=Haliovirga abyssi TaxID=2996794 RepID=A0AAU9DBU6_9FUSO|nr:undecaprenyldiphospho-muramoylpentapeptide beta-N-acetylglucosaminyltransferase [Haliovirga abyssi]BDU49598.1 UDP-N-acetylglucosamine--N-acetylmuramyl-(pentapeptide) pyrophosphoryl-undecaprenol N-acetylglucosamine transferase [Haliovirga abyssi]